MAIVPAGVIFVWPSTNGSWPAGWTRETALDTYYIQGAPADQDADYTVRGQATHTHTSPPHAPIQNAHNHTAFNSVVDEAPFVVGTVGAGTLTATDLHTHGSSSSQSVAAINNPITLTINPNTSNDLLFTTVIFIKSNGTPTGIPVGAYGLMDVDVFPTGWSRVVLSNPYLKGANTGANAGTTGGALDHTHTTPAHTHTQQPHTHNHTASAVSGTVKPVAVVLDSAGSKSSHNHVLIHNAATGTNNPTTLGMDTVNHEPLNLVLNVISNGNVLADLPLGIIGIWGGGAGAIPGGWERYALTDGNFIQGASADGQSAGTVGGSVNHTHNVDDCFPTQNSHVHTITDPGANGQNQLDSGATQNFAADGHTHSHWVPGAKTPLTAGCSVFTDPNTDESAYPPYKRVIFIKYTGELPRIMLTYDYHDVNSGFDGIAFSSLATPQRDGRWKFPQEETEEEQKKRRQIQPREKGVYGPPHSSV